MVKVTAKTRDADVSRLAGPAIRTFFNIADAWGLSNPEQMVLLGVTNPSTFYKWLKQREGKLSRDQLERISYIMGIYKGLQILLPRPDAADSWVREPNTAPLFGGRSALDRMLSGNVADLFLVRQYIDNQRGGGV